MLLLYKVLDFVECVCFSYWWASKRNDQNNKSNQQQDSRHCDNAVNCYLNRHVIKGENNTCTVLQLCKSREITSRHVESKFPYHVINIWVSPVKMSLPVSCPLTCWLAFPKCVFTYHHSPDGTQQSFSIHILQHILLKLQSEHSVT